jgi:hypothetical protein
MESKHSNIDSDMSDTHTHTDNILLVLEDTYTFTAKLQIQFGVTRGDTHYYTTDGLYSHVFPSRPTGDIIKYMDYPNQLYVATSSIPNAGLGLFTLKDLPAKSRLGMYPGIPLTKHQLEERYPKYRHYRYVVKLDTDEYIDAVNAVDLYRFSNSTPIEKEATMQLHYTGYFHTKQAIKAHTELTFRYGNSYRINNVKQ